MFPWMLRVCRTTSIPMFRWKVTLLVCRTLPHTWQRPIELTWLIGLAAAMLSSWPGFAIGPLVEIGERSESRYKAELSELLCAFPRNDRFVQPPIKHKGARDFWKPARIGDKMPDGSRWWATKDLNL